MAELIVGQNKIEQIPQTVGKMTRLVNITAPSNRLTELPTELSELTVLTIVRGHGTEHHS